jgi:lipoprotein-releasing system ATP-binding protein
MPDPLIKLTNITKRYRDGGGEIIALKSINLDIASNSKVAIMGPSGSGKSTFLQIVGGLDKPSEGDVTVAGQVLGSMNDRQLSEYRNHYIGFIFQTFNLQTYLTTAENVALPLILGGTKSKAAEAQALGFLEQVGLAEKARRYPAQLSGGEMQRVAIARALAHSPKVILADEPTANLDRDNAENVLTLMSGLKLDGQALIVVTHDDRVAARFERTITFDHGAVASPPSGQSIAPTQGDN